MYHMQQVVVGGVVKGVELAEVIQWDETRALSGWGFWSQGDICTGKHGMGNQLEYNIR